MDPKDRKSSGLGDLKYPLVSDVTKISKSYGVSIPDEVCFVMKFVSYSYGLLENSNNLIFCCFFCYETSFLSWNLLKKVYDLLYEYNDLFFSF